jgi:hypothetical protein
MKSFTVGADPELFLTKDNQIISAAGLFPGTKDAPIQISKNVHLLVDNAALEYNITPTNTPMQLVNVIGEAMNTIEDQVGNSGYGISHVCSHSFEKTQLKHPGNWIFGCDPDFNAWTEEIQPNPKHPDPCFRAAGGHIHIGIPGQFTANKIITLVKCLDITLGLYLATHDTPDAFARREFYGKAGSFRFKPYGLEYRTPSNQWIFNHTLLSRINYHIQRAFIRANNPNENYEYDWAVVQYINTGVWPEALSFGPKELLDIF